MISAAILYKFRERQSERMPRMKKTPAAKIDHLPPELAALLDEIRAKMEALKAEALSVKMIFNIARGAPLKDWPNTSIGERLPEPWYGLFGDLKVAHATGEFRVQLVHPFLWRHSIATRRQWRGFAFVARRDKPRWEWLRALCREWNGAPDDD